jgi:hypothetical protein
MHRYLVGSLVLLSSALIPLPTDAQVRFLDRMQLQPQAPSGSGATASGSPQGDVRVSRRMKSPVSHSKDQSVQSHDSALAIPHWTSSFQTQGAQYPFTVVGSDPSQGATTTIPTVIIPYRLVFSDGGVFDATTDLIDGVTPLAGVVNSPLFKPVPWNAGTTQLGTTQFGDATMRANFWSSIPGDRSGYHVLLSTPTVLPVQVIQVPAGYGYSWVDEAGAKVGIVDFGWLAETTSNLTLSLGIPPQALAIHLMSAVEGVGLDDGGSLGFHYEVIAGSASNPVIQPYIQTAYFSVASQQKNAAGTLVLGHEIAEWLMDPALDNIVPAWQDPAFPHVCDNQILEVGDPLEYISHGADVSLNGRTYKFPEVAFLQWFSEDHHSTSVNGWYSSLNTFSSPSMACPVSTLFSAVSFDFTGATSSVLTGLNNSVNNKMQIVAYATASPNFLAGIVMDFSFDPTTFAFSLGNLREVYFPGSRFTVPLKINDSGQIVGLYVDASGMEHGFLLSNGAYSTIDFPGAIASEAAAINNHGQPEIAGSYVDSTGKVHGFVMIGGKFFPIDAGFAANLAVTAINDHMQMTGVYDTGGALGVAQTFGFTGSLGSLTPLNFPNFSLQPAPTSTLLNSLNNKNEIVGTVKIQLANFLRVLPFLEGDGNFEPVGAGLDGSIASQGLGNNDAGIAVGSFQDPAGIHAGIAVPFQLLGLPQKSSVPLQIPLPFPLH